MIFKDFLPSPPLQPFVKSFGLRHFVFSDEQKIPFKPYVPRIENTLSFYPRSPEFLEDLVAKTKIKRPKVMIMGQYCMRTNRHSGGNDFLALFVNFQPAVLYRLIGLPFNEINNNVAEAEVLLSNEVQYVNERINNCTNYPEMIVIVENYLLKLIKKIKKPLHAVDVMANSIINNPENFTVDEIAKQCYLSSRQLERKFKERMGINPKLYTRIARINKAIKMKINHPNTDWLSIAVSCGYYDYQHLVKDFKEFSTSVPADFFSQDKVSPELLLHLQDQPY